MANINMANVNMLIEKCYLLAGMVIAANMFIMNEVKAMDEKNIQEEYIKKIKEKDAAEYNKAKEKLEKIYCGPCKYIGYLLQWKNTINTVGGALFTSANGLYNFYENKQGSYFDMVFAGWNSKPFAKGYLQFCPNSNSGRAIFWAIMWLVQDCLLSSHNDKPTNELLKAMDESQEEKNKTARNLIRSYRLRFYEYTPNIIRNKILIKLKWHNNNKHPFLGKFLFLFIKLFQDMVSLPLIINFTSRFSISIALDSIIWMVVTYFIAKNLSRWIMQRKI